jgi:ATPase subunit of ABC transporter with duplicated ATPase domains
MIESLEDLAQYVRQTVPDPKSILNLQIKEKTGAVVFIWHGVEFLVKPSMHVFEVRGYNLYITGISTLLQVVLMRRNQNEKMLENALETIEQAEELIRAKNQTQSGVKMLGAVREALGKMIGKA